MIRSALWREKKTENIIVVLIFRVNNGTLGTNLKK